MNRLILFFLTLTTIVFSSTKITLLDINEYKITKEKVLYRINAKSKNINFKRLKGFRFYNKEKTISNSSYYLDGKFISKNLNIKFKKAYFLEGKFIMLNSKGFFKNNSFSAKKATYDEKTLILENTKMNIDNKRYKKYKYKFLL